MSCLEHRKCLAWDNIDPKNTTSLETMASWALKNRARKMTNFKGYDQYVWSWNDFSWCSLEHRKCIAWNTRNVLLGTQAMSCLDHRTCPAWNTRNVLLGTQRMFCFEHKECSASNTRNVLRGAQGMFCLEHKECSASDTRNFLFRTLGVLCCEHKNVLLRAQGMSCLEHTSFRTTKISFRCSCPIVIDFTQRLRSYSQVKIIRN